MKYDVVIGLEVHAELSTKTKIFCSCTTQFGGEVNTHTCPVCLGLPGTLPVLNRSVVEYCIRAGVALDCDISRFSKMDRKNYFYPDLPKAYQISQFDLPLCREGNITLDSGRIIRINRIHIEEDAGKLLHSEDGEYSLVDYNRVGVPLIEIVSEPDISSPDDAVEYLDTLKGILEYADVSDCKMQEGSLRCDVNISLKPHGSDKLGVKTELKNMNSFKALYRAINYEIERQETLLDEGQTLIQETRRWDESKQKTLSMRSKEQAHDYRYFPDPDLVPIVLDDDYIDKIRGTLPELPAKKKEKFVNSYGLPEYDAGIMTSSKHLAAFFEEVNSHYYSPKGASNFIMGELMRLMKEKNMDYKDIPVKPEFLSSLLSLIDCGKISISTGKMVFEEMFLSSRPPEEIISQKNLGQVSDEYELLVFVRRAVEQNPKSVEDYISGKEKALGFLVGQVMKLSRGKANPQIINKLLVKELKR